MGIGEKKTPNAFVQSCEIFTYCENINSELLEEISKKKVTGKKIAKVTTENTEYTKNADAPKTEKIDTTIIDKAFNISINEEEEVHIAQVGLSLRKIDPSFDPRAYGFKNLTKLFESLPKYEVIKNEVNGLNHPLVKLK